MRDITQLEVCEGVTDIACGTGVPTHLHGLSPNNMVCGGRRAVIGTPLLICRTGIIHSRVVVNVAGGETLAVLKSNHVYNGVADRRLNNCVGFRNHVAVLPVGFHGNGLHCVSARDIENNRCIVQVGCSGRFRTIGSVSDSSVSDGAGHSHRDQRVIVSVGGEHRRGQLRGGRQSDGRTQCVGSDRDDTRGGLRTIKSNGNRGVAVRVGDGGRADGEMRVVAGQRDGVGKVSTPNRNLLRQLGAGEAQSGSTDGYAEFYKYL